MRKHLKGIGLAFACILLAGGAARAENTDQAVTVQAQRFMATPVGRTYTGLPVVDVSLSYGVSVAGLDLKSAAGTAELERRVAGAARVACFELGREYPEATPAERECAKAAADQAMAKARELTAVSRLTVSLR